MLSPEYAAGFFDGEGCASLRSQRTAGRVKQVVLEVRVTNTNLEILHLFMAAFGGRISGPYRVTPQCKDCYHWSLRSNKALPFLETIRPYVKVKRNQVELALEFLAYRHQPWAVRYQKVEVPGKKMWIAGVKRPEVIERESAMETRMKQLNRKGSRLEVSQEVTDAETV